jgi:uncharacterized protein
MNPTAFARRDLLRAIAVAPWLSAWPPATEAAAARGAAVGPFALTDVRLLEGPWQRAQALAGRYLLSLSADRLLHNFRVNAGLPPKAPVYGGWESEEPWVWLRCHGHTLGHYLSAAAMMSAATGDAVWRRRVDHIVDELAACQQAAGNGLVCAFPDNDKQLRNGLDGRPVEGVPWYTLHKVLAGLRDAHVHTGSTPALVVLRRLADWIDEAARGTDDAQMQKMLDVEFGGMGEVLADLAALAKEPRYLALARRFDHRVLLDPLAEKRDPLDGMHANTQIPKVLGFARLQQLTGEPRYARAASYFWGRVTGPRSFATGGHGDGEHFFPPNEARAHLDSAKTMETCGIHNMLRLTQTLFVDDPQAAYADWSERALINGILASQDPDSGMVTYFQALRPGYVKLYCTPEHSFWCCTGTGMENHAGYGTGAWFHDANTLVLAQYLASELNWRTKGLRIQQITHFPEHESSQLIVSAARATKFTLRLRHPAWCRELTVKVNGKPVISSREPGRWVDLARSWRDGDRVDIRLPMHLHLAPLPGAPDIAAVMYGPMVLAARLGTEGLSPGADLIVNERQSGEMLNLPQPMPLPRLALGAGGLEAALKRAAGSLSFHTTAAGAQIALAPYHQLHHERTSVYWQLA